MTWHLTPTRRRRMRRTGSLASGLALVAGLLAIGVAATPRSADAAVSSSEQWITAISGTDATQPSTLTFGTSGVTAALGARGAGCSATNVATFAQLTSRQAPAFLSPSVPANALGLNECINTSAPPARTVTLNKPVASPMLHINNLDGSTLTLNDATITQVSGNVASQVVGGNQIVPAANSGTNNCSNTVSTNNPVCASYRLSQGSGPVTSFTMTNTRKAAVTGADGWYWTMSFHVAKLTKAFGADTTRPGQATPLTFTITNPNDEGAVDLPGMGFTDALPTGMTLANTVTTDNGKCGTPVVNGGSPKAGDTKVDVTATDVKAGDTCTITVNVKAGVGTYTNDNTNITTNVGNLVPAAADTLTVEGPDLEVEKSSDATADTRVGDTVTYTVKATNTGSADYPEDAPAVLLDDLSDVLDDATYNGDAAAVIGTVATTAPAYESPLLSWSGPLAKGATVELTYSVTLEPGGDGALDNVAFAPTCETTDPTCETPPTTPACDQDPKIACESFAVPRLTIAKSADRTSLPKDGDSVAYTVTVTNEGPGDYTADAPAAVTDDLSDVVDDATVVDDTLTATAGTPTLTGSSLGWSGTLAAGQSAVITYSVVYDARKPGGDHALRNSACLADESQVLPGEPACATADVPGAALQTWKTSDRPNGEAVRVGDTITYTLHFRNNGKAPATVDEVDDLSDVLDDATVTTAPAAGDGDLAPVRTGDQLAITGTVPAGDTFTITYSVTVKAFADQGDSTLVNVLGADTVCADDPQMCTQHGVSHLTVDKTSDATDATREGDKLTYTVTVTNDGAGDFTAEQPATMSDDLSDVLDDASWNADVAADAGAAVLTGSRLDWSGPLPAGDSATITYSVTLTNDGDHAVRNTACVPQPGAQPSCDDTELLLPRLEASKSVDPSSGSVVETGRELTYTLRFSNTGIAAARVARDDVVAGVLDDAQLVTGPTSSDDALTVSPIADGRFSVDGDLAPGRTVLVTYTVKVAPERQRGDSRLSNFMVGRGATAPATCDPDVERADCTTNPIAEMHDWKTADPASGTVVKAGQRLTYTLHFRNSGTAPVTVDRVDDMSHVVDDAAIVAVPTSSDPSIEVTGIDGRFAVKGTVQPGKTVTVTYGVKVKQPADQGDHVLVNYLLDAGQSAPAKPVCALGPEVDCTVNSVSEITATKSVDPGTGTDVEPGDRLTYSLTFTNSGEGTSTVDYVDHMAGMLDDADLVRTPTTSAGTLTVTTRRDRLVVTGDLAAGRTETVRYSVEVKDYPDQGDHRLENFLAPAGVSAADSCDPRSSTCTENSAVEPDDDSLLPEGLLPDTGGPGFWLLVCGIGLLVGGGAVVAAGRRRPRP